MRRLQAALLLLLGGAPASACSFPEYKLEQPVAVETCRDGLQNFDEVAVDCGPTCGAGCGMGQGCTSNAECKSGSCQNGACSVPTCSDHIRDQTETDIDCGGTDGCDPCAAGKRCDADYDCGAAKCNAGICLPQSCSDGLQNQDESDVDCGGGSCDPCSFKKHCSQTSDCENAQCSQGLCQAPGCSDGVKNGDETDEDCGGSCVPCPDFAGCLKSEDCKSMSCIPGGKICAAPTCSDNIWNGDESALDCGAGCGDPNQKCDNTKTCNSGADCKSGTCNDDGRCVPQSATGALLPTAGWLPSASATFNDGTSPAKAIDGDNNTHWTSGVGQTPGMWYQVDMLKPHTFFALELLCLSNDDYPRSIRVLLSEDGQTFTPATNIIGGQKTLRFDFASAKVARYIKFQVEQDTGGLWWRMDELHVIQ